MLFLNNSLNLNSPFGNSLWNNVVKPEKINIEYERIKFIKLILPKISEPNIIPILIIIELKNKG